MEFRQRLNLQTNMITLQTWREIDHDTRKWLREILSITRTGVFTIESPSNRILDDGILQRDLDKVSIELLQELSKSKEEDADELLKIIITKRYEQGTKIEGTNPSGDETSGKSKSNARKSKGA